MSEKQRQAQQERRMREKEAMAQAAASAAESAAESVPDVEPTSQDDPVTPRPRADHSARQEMLESLRNKPEDMEEYVRSETNEADAPETTEPVSEQAPAPVEPVAPAAPEMVTVKIDGEESQVLKSEVDSVGGVAAYQMLKASEKRYEQANREKQELAQMLTAARQMMEQAKPKEPEKSPDELIREKVLQIQMGTPEEAAAALQSVLEAGRQPQINPVELANQIYEYGVAKSAAQEFKDRNSDLFANPYFAQLAVFMERDKLSKSKPSDWKQFYTNLETEFRNALGKPATTQVPSLPTQQTVQPTSGTVADKLARKADIVNLPTAASRVSAPEEPKPLSRDDRINLLRRARGQPVG
jgi:hypothetical protein